MVTVSKRNRWIAADWFADFFERNRNGMFLCVIATFAWGLVTHAYIFLHSSFSHDSLNEFNAAVFGNAWRIQLGRIFVPAYRFLVREAITLPWLIGVLSLLYISAAVFLTVKLFGIRSRLLTALIAGVYTANITVTATAATYIHDLDCNMLALALAVLAVYLWKRFHKGFLYGMLPLCVSMGLYQSYLSVAITLVILYLVLQLLDGHPFAEVFGKGLKSLGMIVGAGVLYYLAIQLVCRITGLSLVSGTYNSMDSILSRPVPEILYTVVTGYIQVGYKLCTAVSAYPGGLVLAVHIVMVGISGAVVLFRIVQREIGVPEKLLALLLLALVPLGMNVTYILTGGMSHDLMQFAFWLAYLFVLLIAWWAVDRKLLRKPVLQYGQRCAAVGLVFVVLWGNVQTANAAYLKKDLEQQASLSLLTRIVYRMEDCPGYVTGQTPVVFVGMPDAALENQVAGFERLYEMVGNEIGYALGVAGQSYYQAYFDNVLQNPAVMADEGTWFRFRKDDRVAAMPCYPAEGSVGMLDGVMIVKLGERFR